MRTTRTTAPVALAIGLALIAGFAQPVFAQQAASPPAASPGAADDFQKQFEETQKLIEQMQQRLERINRTAGERERELDVLDSKVGEAVEHIDGGRGEGEVPATAPGNADTDADIAALVGDGSGTLDQLRQRLSKLAAMLTVERRTVGLLKAERDAMAGRLGEATDKRAGVEQDVAALEKAKTTAESAAATARQDAAGREARIRELEADTGRLGKAVADKDAELARQSARAADLDDRLTKAVSAGSSELRPFRTDLLGRLRTDFGDRPGVRIDGDVVIVQAELLFGPGVADTQVVASDMLRKIAAEVREVARGIPSHVSWILRVDGHTDSRAPRGNGFANNWQLAAARAMAVADALLREGVPAEHLGIMSFAGNQPLDPRDDEIAQRRNRRIEIRLTQR